MQHDPEELDLALIRSELAQQHKVAYGVVAAFTAATATEGATATVELAVRFKRRVDGVVETYTPVPLKKVPVQYGRLVYPLEVGDEVVVHFLDRGSATAYINGGAGNEPDGDRRNALSDAYCVPMNWSKAGGANGHVAGSVVIDRGTMDVLLGKAATRGVARLNDEVAVQAAWLTWFTAVGLATSTVPPAGLFGTISTASSVVKAE